LDDRKVIWPVKISLWQPIKTSSGRAMGDIAQPGVISGNFLGQLDEG